MFINLCLTEFKQAFKMFDVNGDGTVTEDELCQSIRILGGNPTEKEVTAIMAELDKDSAYISFVVDQISICSKLRGCLN